MEGLMLRRSGMHWRRWPALRSGAWCSAWLLLVCLCAHPHHTFAMTAAVEDDPATIQLPENRELALDPLEVRMGDLPDMRESGVIRVLVEYSKTDFFVVRGDLFGFEYELMKQYEAFLNGNRSKHKRTRLVFVPVPFGEIIPALAAGKGDIAAASITITPEREKSVAFSTPYIDHMAEVLVASGAADPPETLEDLEGRRVYVLRGSSEEEHLRELNRSLANGGRKPIEIAEAPAEFSDEDLIEMTGAGIFPYAFVDSQAAGIWARVVPNLKVQTQIRLADEGRIAWAVRKESRQLLASINDFFASSRGVALQTAHKLIGRYYETTHWITETDSKEYEEKLERYAAHFQAFCSSFNLDWLMAAALSYHESRFDESLVSRTGAVGLMQVLPSTGAQLGILNVRPAKDNIHAGVCYLDLLKQQFTDPDIAEDQRIYFALAAYNAGPNRIRRLRTLARKMGLDPNVWFGNVEFAALHVIGEETFNYVANIKKYYTIYRCGVDLLDKRDTLHEQLMGSSPTR